MNGTKEFTDVWNFPSVRPYKGKHPAEKPLDMLKHAIEATSYEGDIVLDCFGGSGSTLQAALETNRLTISIEIESEWVESISSRMQTYCDLGDLEFHSYKTRDIQKNENLDIFSDLEKEPVI